MRILFMPVGCIFLVGSVAVATQDSSPNRAAQTLRPTATPASVTVPLIFEDNRVFVELAFRRADGSFRKARTWVDTGGGWFAVTERLAKDIGAERKGEPFREEEGEAVDIAPPAVYLGSLPLDLSSAHVVAKLGADRIDLGVEAEAFLPARVLMHYQVVFDYPARRFTLARPGVLRPRGRPISSLVQKESGFPRIEIEIDGKAYGFLLDTGAAYTMVSRDLLDRLATEHPSWPQLTGAVGEANMLGNNDTGALMVRLDKIRWGPFEIGSAGAVSRRPGVFETYMSKLMTGGIVGAVAGNILHGFRVEIDYQHGMTYLKQSSQPEPNDLDSVGIIFRTLTDGTYYVAGVADKDENDVFSQCSVNAGDRILQVDRLKVTGASRSALIQSLTGRPGDRHKVVVEHDGKQSETECIVRHLL
jgi:predicted aspartyl protease